DHVAYLLQTLHDAAQVPDALDLDGEEQRHAAIVVGLGEHGEDIRPLIREQRADVLQQANTVERVNPNRDRVRFVDLAAPGDGYKPLGVRDIDDVRAILAVVDHATATRRVADNGIPGNGPATVRLDRQQIACAHDLDAGRRARRLDHVAGLEDILRRLVELLRDRLRGHRAVADRGEEVVQLGVTRELLQDVLELHVEAEAAQLALQRLLALGDVLVALLPAEPLADLFTGGGGLDVAVVRLEPVTPWAVDGLAGLDLDDLGVLELVVQRDHLAVHGCADALVADLGMDAIGEVDRRRAVGQLDDVPGRRETVDHVLEDIRLERFDEFLGIRNFVVPVHELSQPGDFGFEALIALRAFLVAPVGGDTVFGDLVHLIGADLDLDRMRLRPDDGRMEALVHALLRRRDVVVDLAGNRVPLAVYQAKDAVAVLHRVHENTDADNIIDLLERPVLAVHLPVDRVDVLLAAVHLGLDVRAAQQLVQLGGDLLEHRLGVFAARFDLGRDRRILGRLEIAKGQVLELGHDLPNTQPIRQRGVNLHSLLGDTLLFVRRHRAEGTHVVQAVGEIGRAH